MRGLLFLIIILALSGCNKPNATPELNDEIFSDISNSSASAKKDLESERKKLEGFKMDIDKAIPQTGEIKFAQKRFFESEANVQKLQQLQKYLELKAESRKTHVRTEYLKAFKAGSPWPTVEELESYKIYKQVSKIAPSWDTRKRIEAYEKQSNLTNKANVPEREKKAATKAAEH